MSDFLNRRLLQFLVLYETRSVHRAAEQLGISQPALTVSLRHLEQSLDIALFERSVKGLEPTPAGDVCYRYACNLRQGARHAVDELAALARGTGGHLRVGAGVAWTTTLLPAVLSEIHARYPQLCIDLVTGIGDQLTEQFLAGKVDVLLAAAQINSLADPDIHCEHLANLPMVAIVDPGHPLAAQATVSIAELAGTDWAGFYEDESMAHFAAHYLAGHGLPPARVVMRTNSAAALTTLVRGSRLVTILMSPLADAACKDGLVALRLDSPLWTLPVNLYYRKVVSDVPAIQAFVERVWQSMPVDGQ